MNRKLNDPKFRIFELRLGNTVRHEFDDWTVIGLSWAKRKVQIQRIEGAEVIERIIDFKTLQPVPLWDADTMLNAGVMRHLGFENVDSWTFKQGSVIVRNRFPADHHAVFEAKGVQRPVYFQHELENLLIDQGLCDFLTRPLGPNFSTTV